jgi:hypothetical protein
MGFDGADFYGVGGGDFLVGFAFGHKPEHEKFLGGKEGKKGKMVGSGIGWYGWSGEGYGGVPGSHGPAGMFKQEAHGKEGNGNQGKVIIHLQIAIDHQLANDLEADDDGGGNYADAQQPGVGFDKMHINCFVKYIKIAQYPGSYQLIG